VGGRAGIDAGVPVEEESEAEEAGRVAARAAEAARALVAVSLRKARRVFMGRGIARATH
jgi:hypothetical protein